ncbi:MAG: XTP/dITP diphosphohydrolase [Gammaproteobacteria bacterium]|jgi:XTP/dITP diphosphohydrolase
MRILLATQNKKKRAEFEAMFAPLGVELLPARELPDTVEDEPDFRGNARKKAAEAALATGEWCLADDSGLEVEYLDGAPGVLSARFAGTHGDDAANNAKLLQLMDGVPEAERGARFVCALCLCRPDGSPAAEVFGQVAGRMLEGLRGSGDFGYDPLFLFTEPGFDATGKSFAELEPGQKSAVSHRGRALALLASELPALRAD